jgi:hypothetical protein
VIVAAAGLLLGALLAVPAAAQQGVVLQRVPAPDTDTIRWVTTAPSIARVAELGAGGRLLRLDRFGRKALHELDAALPSGALVLDLRNNQGGSLRRMLQVAGRLTGPVSEALRLIQGSEVRVLAIPQAAAPAWHGPITVLVGAETMSSAEVLAALLRRHAGAAVLGERTFGKDYTLRVEPIGQRWRALVPDRRIEVPDEVLAGGLVPDGPIPPELALRIATN